MAGVCVRFEPEGLSAIVPEGTTLHEAAAVAGVTIAAPCGGLGRCGSCAVPASGALTEPGQDESSTLGASAARGMRLACRARVAGPGDVFVTRPAVVTSLRAQIAGPPPLYAHDLRTGAEFGLPPGTRPLGAAVDVGTTTIVVRVHALDDGSAVGEAGFPNPQAAWGADVLTRVSRALAGHDRDLRSAVTGEIARQVARIVDRPSLADASLAEMTIVGNPAMTHLLLGADVAPLAAAPYEGALVDSVRLDAAAADMPQLGQVGVTVGPAVSAFIGADAVAAVVATGVADRDEPSLLLDLGTNGEVVLCAGGSLLAASAPAGPAFEGGGLTAGMPAESGAIERVWLEGDGLGLVTIGGGEARGLCGSGLMDLLALLVREGVVDAEGRMSARGVLASRVTEVDGITRLAVTDSIELTQLDVRALQLAKGAVTTAVDVLLEEAGVPAGAVREVVVAGGFGQHLRPDALAVLGIIPRSWVERVTFAGNAALAGASAMLLSALARDDAERIARGIRTVPLAEREDFQRRFIASLGFPPSPQEGDRP